MPYIKRFAAMTVAALACLLLAAPASAQWTTWTERDGLEDSEIHSVAQNDEGTMWIGSFGGVNTFNGVWENVEGQSSPVDHYQSILASEDLEDIWIATKSGELIVHDGNDGDSVDIGGLSPRALLLDSDGTVWAGTDGGVVEIDPTDGSIQVHTVQSSLGQLPSNTILALYQDDEGHLWVGTDNGVARYLSTWEGFSTDDGLARSFVQAIAQDIDGRIWFGHGDESSVGASLYDPALNQWSIVRSTDGLVGNQIRAIIKDVDGSLWFGTQSGVSHLVINNGESVWESFTTSDGLADNQVNAIYQDRDGALWFGTFRGLSRFATLPSFTSQNTGGGLPGNRVTAVVDDLNGWVWMGTNRGLGRYLPDEDRWETHTAASTGGALGSNSVHDLFVSNDGALWAGTDLGVSRFDGLTWERYLPNRPVTDISQTRDGLIWAVVDKSLAEYDGTAWTGVPPPGEVGPVASVFRANDGAMWIGAENGVARRDPISGLWEVFTTQGTPRVTFASVNAIAQDSTEAMWFLSSQDGTVLTYDAENDVDPWETVTKDDGLISNFINTLSSDREGIMWFGAFSGAARFDGENWQTYTTAEGLANNGVNAIHAAADGAIWFGTDGGATSFSRPPNSLVETRILSTIPNPLPVNRIFIQARGFEVGAEGLPPLSYQLTDFQADPASDTSDDPRDGWTAFEVDDASGFELRPELLETGAWSLHVRAIDRNGRIDPTPEQEDFVVDLIPPTVVISSPRQDESVTGTVSIQGAAFDNSPDFDTILGRADDGSSDFRSYIVEYARDGSQDWQPINESTTEVDPALTQSPVLGRWDTSDLFGNYQLRVTATDTLDHISQFIVKVKVVSALQLVVARDGDEFESASSAAISGTAGLRIPQNGLERDATVEITYLGTLPGVGGPPNATSTSIIYEVGPDSLEFEKGSTLTFGFDDSEVAAADVANLAVYARGNGWAETGRLGGTASNGEISVRIDEPGIYGLFIAPGSGTNADVLDIDIQPRAFAPNGSSSVLSSDRADIMFELGGSGSVDVRVYDLGGNLVQEVVEDGNLNAGWNTVQWDGRDTDNKVVTSGLYIVVVRSAEGVARKTVAVLNRN